MRMKQQMSPEEIEQKIAQTKELMSQINLANEEAMAMDNDVLDKLGDDSLSIQEAKLSDVKRQEEAMQSNVFKLIINLDTITQGFGEQFKDMQTLTTSEKIIGFFSSDKASEMKEDRIKSSSIEDQLQSLLSKASTLQTILETQLSVLTEQKGKEANALESSMTSKEEVSKKIKELEKTRDEMEGPILELTELIGEETDSSVRATLEKDYQLKVNAQNDVIDDIKVSMTESQSHEKYIKMHQTILDSIGNQISAQKSLIKKLEVDTKNRIISYEATLKSLKTAEQQQTAHRVNDIGMEVDTSLTKTMALIGAGAQNDLMKMLEKHPDFMEAQEAIQNEKAIADDAFYRRFAKVAEEHEKGVYSK